MRPLMTPATGILISYIVGSIPFAYLAGRVFAGIDLREHGSGNLGATNAFRVLGWPIGFLVFALDIVKGALPVMLLPHLLTNFPPASDHFHYELWQIAFGLAAIVGHTRPIFLLWQGGGKGVATSCGVFFGLVPNQTLDVLAVFFIMTAITHYVSVGSLSASILLPIIIPFERGFTPVFWFALVMSIFLVYMHRGNIARLRRGQEPVINFKRRTLDRSRTSPPGPPGPPGPSTAAAAVSAAAGASAAASVPSERIAAPRGPGPTRSRDHA
jgi:glycerol-3-phosphate acyltransferase PlsY